MRILDLINRTTPFLEKHGIESPRLTIELLLAHVLQKKRLQLYLEFERELEEPTLVRLRDMVKRRVAGEPLQYITGEADFCGLKLQVDRRALIPRPETELLVETAVARLGTAKHIVDLCTGSGCIAVALAKQLPANCIVYATDLSAEALVLAQANAQRHQVEKSIRFLQGDLLSALPDSLMVDAIISNPPYIASGDWAKLPKEVRDFEPVQALVAGEDGLEIYRRILDDARHFLTPNGILCLELGAGQRQAVADYAGVHGWSVDAVLKDLQGHERVLVAKTV